ncbi:MAG TPA: hypothetical protein VF394_01610 [Candidatus Acidoferrum sp.]
MNAGTPQTVRKRSERGYALLVVIFLVTVLLLSTMVVATNILTEGRREKEKEMIWRGNQYARGVKLHFRKLGRFPTSLDDLTKPKVGSLRFMRQAYKDPMNKEDGSWRFIYVGPAGQLIGSLKPPQQNILFPKAGGVGTPANALNGPGTPAQPGAIGQQGPAGTQPGGTASGTNPPATTGTPVGTDQSDSGSNPQPIPAGDTSPIIGGNIIGVGSKINKSSIIVYDTAKNYHLFEFIWNPSKDNFGVGQPGLQTGTGLGGQPIGVGSPGVPGQPLGQNPTTPQPNPQQPPQNPPPQQ